jgi:hypothetical protein
MKRRIVLVVLAVLVAGCSKNPAAPPPPASPASVAVTPSVALVLVHQQLSLTATVSNSSATTVEWRLAREPGLADTISVGTITPTGPLTAVYRAPDRVVTPGTDYTVTVLAVATSDTTLRGQGTIFVPRVRIAVSPASVSSVPPGTWIPHRIKVENGALDDFTLFVEGITGGDAGVGTWEKTTDTTAVYKAPVHDTLFVYSLLATAVEDPARFATATATVRAGFPLPTPDPMRSEYAPEWNPTDDRLAFVRGGGPWELVVYDFGMQSEQVLATFSWTGVTYDGRIAWSDDGARIAFSEESSGLRMIGLVNEDGSGRTSFAPDATVNFEAACFLPGRSDSLYVAQSAAGSGTSSLRAYAVIPAPVDPGRLIVQAAAGATVGAPDAYQPVSGRPLVGYETTNGNFSTVFSIADNDGHAASAATLGTGLRTQVRWATLKDGVAWLTYVGDDSDNLYRVQRSGLSAPQRCYVDFFPELSGDLKPDPPPFFHFVDAHAVARVEPDGHTRIWVIGSPPSWVVPVSRAVEIELRRAGVWTALAPRDWRIRRFSP